VSIFVLSCIVNIYICLSIFVLCLYDAIHHCHEGVTKPQTHHEYSQSRVLARALHVAAVSIYLSIGINVRFAAMMADVGDGLKVSERFIKIILN